MASSTDTAMEQPGSSGTLTQVVEQPTVTQVQEGLNVLRLRRPDMRVGWSEDTVDNEGMGRKKSKCCCVYRKPVQFGESSSETDDECENCYGHVEVKKAHRKKKKKGKDDGDSSHDDCNEGGQQGGETKPPTNNNQE